MYAEVGGGYLDGYVAAKRPPRWRKLLVAVVAAAVLVLLVYTIWRIFSLVNYTAVSTNSGGQPHVLAAHTSVEPAVVVKAVKTVPAVTVHTSPPSQNNAPAATVPSCVPDTSYSLPGQMNLSEASTGLVKVIDSPDYYRVYGDTSAQIRTQVARCAPVVSGGDKFAGLTSYAINWRYDYGVTSDGKCAVSDASIGLHINQALPLWKPDTNAASDLASSWSAFIASLKTHENGHVQLDLNYAQQMLSDLQTFPAASCDNFTNTVNTKLNNDIAQLNYANSSYDARTNHGATQGAILP